MLHGKRFLVGLWDWAKEDWVSHPDAPPAPYYVGRLNVNTWHSNAENSKLVIDYVFLPYRYSSFTDADEGTGGVL